MYHLNKNKYRNFLFLYYETICVKCNNVNRVIRMTSLIIRDMYILDQCKSSCQCEEMAVHMR